MIKKEYLYVVLAMVAIYFAGSYLFPLKENFRMTNTAVCPQCHDDSDCDKCGIVGAKCVQETGGPLGTCKKV